MVKQLLTVFLTGVLSISFAAGTKAGSRQTGEAKADSMVYDEPTEWRVFSIEGPGMAFTIQGELLWLASDKGVGSLCLSGKKKNEIIRYKKLGTMAPEGITCIAADRMGGIWFGSPAGVAVKNGADFTNYTTDNGLSDNNVTCMAITPDNGVWVGTENGLNVYRAGSWKKVATSEGLVSNKIQALLVDKNGSLWAGTDKGIGVYSAGRWTTHSMKNKMSWNDTKALGLDASSGMVWAAVGEKDVNTYNGKEWNVYMDIASGITSIMVDSKGRVWFGGGSGLVKFNGDDWISDTKKLGVPAAQINQLFKDDEGNLWFGMENGVLRLDNPYPH